MSLRVGFLGAGLIATYHSKSLRRSGVDIVRAGVHDPDQGRAEAFAEASGHRVCRSEEEVLDGCDAVYVCTWTSEHRRLVEQVAARRKAVFCEKPLAPSLADADAIAAALETAGVTNQVGLVLQRSPAMRVAHHLATRPAAGRLMAIAFRDDQFIPIEGTYGSTWRADVARAGAGTLLEHSIHDVDLLCRFAGEVERVSATQASFHGIPGIEDVVAAQLQFTTGATATLLSVWHDNLARPSLRRIELFAERRLVVVEGDDWYGPVSWTDRDGGTGSLVGQALVAEAERIVQGTLNPDRAFVEAAQSGGPGWPDAAHALAAHRVVEALYRSAAGRRVVAGDEVPAVERVSTDDVLGLRARLLRTGTRSSDPHFDGDEDPATVHLSVAGTHELVGVSTWLRRPYPGRPDRPAVQLRGMAVTPERRGEGLGHRLLEAGAGHATAGGAELVWARARDSALGFYLDHGFVVAGEGFVDETTGLPHHLILRALPARFPGRPT